MVPQTDHTVNGAAQPAPKSRPRLMPREPPDIGNSLSFDDDEDFDADCSSTSKKRGSGSSRNGDGRSKRRGSRPTKIKGLRRRATEAEEDEDDEDDQGGVDDAAADSGSTARPTDEFVGSVYQPDSSKNSNVEGIFAPAWAIQLARTKAELLVLAQLAYWSGVAKDGKLRAKIHQDGHYWIGKTYDLLAVDVGMVGKDEAVRWAVRKLKERGIVVVQHDASDRYPLNLRLSRIGIDNELRIADVANDAVEEDDHGDQ